MPTLTAPPRERRRPEQELSHPATDHRARNVADIALTRQIQEALRQSPYRRLHMISADVRNGVAVLAGRVSSFHVKQVAYCLVSDLEGLRRVDNRLEVTDCCE